ncbi:hypothetical protein GOBAR_AA02836 [Gossypium barbadense]|uniref:Formamidopyrimidine-DNA glycosylase catalytic domain-containing protein n=1 Tax=Gossypium barbadense TaxID=3634 RepID=A0A2P5YQ60_GOSBA|nr:hypothetical protein GOBAR_AA02836 [Gossypium barbadense]
MPELPEVEAARRAIEENCLGKKIKRAIIANDSKVIEGVSSVDFESALLGKTIVSAHRKGKNLWLHLDSPPFPSFQFGMAGAIYIKGVAVTKYKRSAVKDNDEWPSKYSKFFVELDDGLELSFTDKRRFARVRLLKDPTSVPPISELGPDALFEPMTINEFTDSLSKKKIGIKALLLDQARIHPLQICSSLSKENCATLHNCIKEVIEKAVEVGADSSQFPSNWIFHSREKKPGKAFVDDIRICTGVAEIEWNSSYKSSSGGNNDGSSEEDDEDLTEKGRKVKTNTSNKQAKTVKTSKRPVSSQDEADIREKTNNGEDFDQDVEDFSDPDVDEVLDDIDVEGLEEVEDAHSPLFCNPSRLEELFVGQRFENKTDCVFSIKQYCMKLSIDCKVAKSTPILYVGEFWRASEGCG